jgi:hypothetical protein
MRKTFEISRQLLLTDLSRPIRPEKRISYEGTIVWSSGIVRRKTGFKFDHRWNWHTLQLDIETAETRRIC